MTNNLYIPLTKRATIQISGKDSKQFLQGLITNDINKVNDDKVIYALMLTPQGKFLYDFFIAHREGAYLLDCQKELLPQIIKKLSMYKLRSDVQIEDVSQKYEIAALLGDKVFEVMEGRENNVRQFCKGVAYIDPRNDKIFARSFIEIDNDYQSFEAFDFQLGAFVDYEYARINACVPEGGADLESGGAFPHDFGMDSLNAVDYNKGCYVGQEVTARVHHKGNIRKRLYVVESNEENKLSSGQEVKSGDEKIGQVFSTIKNVALAVLIQEKVEKNNFVCNVNEMKIKVRK
ncbi:MAG: hypothetical protein PQ612_06510 [Rickettsiales bacterium]|nr:hypothetical protein [Pseudomonadota bacterium]MDA0966625.1 hypothetical protein [Pseudomonadota bacterium]MDG4543653.1 hypothetical protein [Rickettsiales bacterium]MDG4545800.1 hypothetical protein [Rickettsiales bacterium]MDG4547426.1 hypothetical protein [Rickettsiales bacterium]